MTSRLGPSLLGWVLALALAAPATAQSLNFGAGQSDQPIEVRADEGIEWQQENLVFLARGNAVATRGEVEVFADLLRAYYREVKDRGTEIYRLDAEGNVRIVSPDQVVQGDLAIYDVDKAVLVVSGTGVRLETPEQVITAERQLEYWENRQLAVARGNAVASREGKRLRADVLTAKFQKNAQGRNTVRMVEAFENVRIDADKDVVTSDRGVYDLQTGIATLTGSVKITRGGNQLNGCTAEVNLNTNVSKLFGCGDAGAGSRRVRTLLQPERKKATDGK